MGIEKFNFYIVTPVIIKGATNVPELRSPSIKGILRWWLRVVLPPEMRSEYESELFGSTEKVARIRFFPITDRLNTEIVNPRHRPWDHPLFYFNYSVKNREAYSPNQTFSVQMAISTNLDNDIKQRFLEALIFLSFFGGIGARNRRGYGSVTVQYNGTNKDIQNYLNQYLNYKNFNELKANIKEIISKFNYPIMISDYCHISNMTVYSTEHGFNSYIDAIKYVIKIMREVRNVKKNNGYIYDIKPLIKNFKDNKRILSIPSTITIESAPFGLPINYQSRSLKNQLTNAKSIGVVFSGKNFERLASPLLIKIHKIQNRYYPIISHFNHSVINEDLPIIGKFYASFRNRDDNFKTTITSKLNISYDNNLPKFIKNFLNNFEKII